MAEKQTHRSIEYNNEARKKCTPVYCWSQEYPVGKGQTFQNGTGKIGEFYEKMKLNETVPVQFQNWYKISIKKGLKSWT